MFKQVMVEFLDVKQICHFGMLLCAFLYNSICSSFRGYPVADKPTLWSATSQRWTTQQHSYLSSDSDSVPLLGLIFPDCVTIFSVSLLLPFFPYRVLICIRLRAKSI